MTCIQNKEKTCKIGNMHQILYTINPLYKVNRQRERNPWSKYLSTRVDIINQDSPGPVTEDRVTTGIDTWRKPKPEAIHSGQDLCS